ncbi:MAG: hypothetical protein JSV52_11560 [Candidatus Zixiibacteriota bacterium]|nr:MAG: hypothetical protein JSV52_11560 [candidate division Zixibacteria bacterium]
MTLARNFTKCPYCREEIAEGAIRCKHCHADLSDLKKKESVWAKYNCFRTGFLVGILFTIVLSIILYLHFTSGN